MATYNLLGLNFDMNELSGGSFEEWTTPSTVTYVETSSSGPVNHVTSGDLNVPKPTGLAVGDLMICHLMLRNTSNLQTIDSVAAGWTTITASSMWGIDHAMYYKIANVSDVSQTNFVWSVTTGGNGLAVGRISTYRGFDASNPIGDFASGTATGTTTISLPSVDVTADNSMVLIAAGVNDDDNFSTWSLGSLTTTERYDDDYDTGSGQIIGIGAATAPSPNVGATGTGSIYSPGTSNYGWAVVVINAYDDRPQYWYIDSGDIEKDITTYKLGTASAKFTNAGELYQDSNNPNLLEDKPIVYRCWVKTSTAGIARISITDDAGSEYSSYHSGSGDWELLEVTKEIVNSVTTQVRFACLVDGAGTANFDVAYSPRWYFDDFYNFDPEGQSEITIVSDVDLGGANNKEWFHYREPRDILIISDIESYVDYIKFIDLLPLVPEKFRDSDILKLYIRYAGQYVGSWQSKIDDIEKLLNPNTVGDTYIQYLADLIFLTVTENENSTLEDLRKQVRQAMDWYRVKGTYESLNIAAYMNGVDVNIYDFYTTDYLTIWSPQEWWAGDEGENPPGLSSAYYKSAHFGIEYVLNQVFQPGSDQYLWRGNLFTNLQEYVERLRPVNTVPHYILKAAPETTESGEVETVPGEIQCAVLGDWDVTRKNFDMWYLSSDDEWNFDNDAYGGDKVYFDQAYDTFLTDTNRWVVGTGNKGGSPGDTGFTIENPVANGIVNNINVYSDRTEYDFIVGPGLDITGVSEIGLYSSDGLILRIGCTCPDIDLISSVELRVVITVFQI